MQYVFQISNIYQSHMGTGKYRHRSPELMRTHIIQTVRAYIPLIRTTMATQKEVICLNGRDRAGQQSRPTWSMLSDVR